MERGITMRKPAKSVIASDVRQFSQIRPAMEARIASCGADGPARARLMEWVSDLAGRIEAGDLRLMTTWALGRSIVREVENWESGYYVRSTPGGTGCVVA